MGFLAFYVDVYESKHPVYCVREYSTGTKHRTMLVSSHATQTQPHLHPRNATVAVEECPQ